MKLADSQKGKMVQTQLPAAMVPIAIPLPAGYVQPGKAHVSTAVGYSAYPQAVATYPNTAYQGHAAAPYPPQTQISYAHIAVKKDPVGLPAAAPAGVSAYPYYITKQ